MNRIFSFHGRALLCAALLVVCTLAAMPFAEVGINDDFSYIYSARALALTGHVHYVGWASAMVGWQLAWGALFIKLFGFSFSVTRLSVLCIAAASAFLLQRVLVRCGLTENNSTLVTLTVMLSPLGLALAFSFMTDMSGLFCTIVCLYCCVRALQTDSMRPSTGWLVVAALSSAIGGTARQTGWFGLLVMVPCTFWLLRKRRPPVLLLALVWLLSAGFVYASMKWFYRQPYSVQELPVDGYIDRDLILQMMGNVARAALQCCLLALPVLIGLVPLFPSKNRKAVISVATVVGITFALMMYAAHRHELNLWLPPYHKIGNFYSSLGVVDSPEVGIRPASVPVWAQAGLMVVTLAAAISLVFFVLGERGKRAESDLLPFSTPGPRPLDWRQVLWLIVPFTLAYLALVMHRAAFAFAYDRYFLPLLPLGLLLVVRLYQDRLAREMPRFCYAVLALCALVGMAMVHDTFADRRAIASAGGRLMAAGIPRTNFYGGFEYDAWTQVDHMGWMNVIAMMWPNGFHMEKPVPRHMKVKPCGQMFAPNYPAVTPHYGISFDPTACDGPSRFSPEVYHTWLPPFTRELYILNVTKPTF